MNIIYESNVNMLIAIDQSKKYYLDISKYNSKNHQEIQKQNCRVGSVYYMYYIVLAVYSKCTT